MVIWREIWISLISCNFTTFVRLRWGFHQKMDGLILWKTLYLLACRLISWNNLFLPMEKMFYFCEYVTSLWLLWKELNFMTDFLNFPQQRKELTFLEWQPCYTLIFWGYPRYRCSFRIIGTKIVEASNNKFLLCLTYIYIQPDFWKHTSKRTRIIRTGTWR